MKPEDVATPGTVPWTRAVVIGIIGGILPAMVLLGFIGAPPIWDDVAFVGWNWTFEGRLFDFLKSYPVPGYYYRPLTMLPMGWLSGEDFLANARIAGIAIGAALVVAGTLFARLLFATPHGAVCTSPLKSKAISSPELLFVSLFIGFHASAIPGGIWLAGRAEMQQALFLTMAILFSTLDGRKGFLASLAMAFAAVFSKDTAALILLTMLPTIHAALGRRPFKTLLCSGVAAQLAFSFTRMAHGVEQPDFLANLFHSVEKLGTTGMLWVWLETIGKYVSSLLLPWAGGSSYHVAGSPWSFWPLVRDLLALAVLLIPWTAKASTFAWGAAAKIFSGVSLTILALATIQTTQTMTWDNIAMDRYLLALSPIAAGFWIWIARVTGRTSDRKIHAMLAFIGCATIVGYATRIHPYSSEEGFWRAAVEAAPESVHLHAMRLRFLTGQTKTIVGPDGSLGFEKPQGRLAERMEEALSDSLRARRNITDNDGARGYANPSESLYIEQSVKAMSLLGQDERAREWLVAMGNEGIGAPQTHLRLAWLNLRQGRCDAAAWNMLAWLDSLERQGRRTRGLLADSQRERFFLGEKIKSCLRPHPKALHLD